MCVKQKKSSILINYLKKINKTSHYCFINDFSRLIRSQRTKYEHKLIICKRCFSTFGNKPNKNKPWGQTGLNEHKKICNRHKLGKPVMMEENDSKIIKFTNFFRNDRIPIVIYADFECLLKPINNSINTKKTTNTHIHEAMSYGFYVKIDYNIIPRELINQYKIPRKLFIYRGANASKHFMTSIIEISNKIYKLYKINKPMNKLTNDEKIKFQNATACEMCLKEYDGMSVYKVRDHSHFTGKFRRALCLE